MFAASTAAVPSAVAAGGDAREASRAWSPFFAVQRPAPVVDARHVIVTFDDPSLGEWEQSGGKPFTAKQRKAWVEAALERQSKRIDALAKAGVQFQVEHRYIRVLNGVSIMLHGDSGQLMRGIEGVAQVSHVRTLWPMAAKTVDAGVAGAAAAAGGATGADEARVRVAVLDESVDAAHPAIGGAKVTRFDATSGDGDGAKPAKGGATEQIEGHGTAVAGAVLQGAGEARGSIEIESIRTLERRPTTEGNDALLGDSDDLLAGLEHAVDPDGNGDLGDAADIAVVASGTPFASFADSPEARAVAGANGLGTLVVASVGNDGRSGGDVGTVSSVAAATEALAVSAVDARGETPVFDVRIAGAGIEEELEDRPALGSSKADAPDGEIPIAVVEGAGGDVTDYLDESLRSRVAGKVALVQAREDVLVADQARAAADAGAVALLVATGSGGASAAAGTIDVRGADIPMVAITASSAKSIRTSIADGSVLTAEFDRSERRNPAFGEIPGFASASPRFDGVGRVDVVAPGVGMPVAGVDGGWRVLSGTSIAAGWAAGQVASVAAAHPDWDASTLRSVLLATAKPLGSAKDRPSALVQGAGAIDAAAAAAGAWRVGTGRIDFGAVAPGASARRDLALSALLGSAAAAGTGSATPAILLDAGGNELDFQPALDGSAITIDVPKSTTSGAIGGWLVLPDLDVRVPWTATVRDSVAAKVPMRATLDRDVIRPAIGPGAFASALQLSIGGGDAGDEDGLGLAAVQRLELHLFDAAGKDRGVIGGLDDALPGIYDFGLTGRDAAGKQLKPGAWEVRVRYVPATDPDGAWRSGPVVSFTVAKPSKPATPAA